MNRPTQSGPAQPPLRNLHPEQPCANAHTSGSYWSTGGAILYLTASASRCPTDKPACRLASRPSNGLRFGRESP